MSQLLANGQTEYENSLKEHQEQKELLKQLDGLEVDQNPFNQTLKKLQDVTVAAHGLE